MTYSSRALLALLFGFEKRAELAQALLDCPDPLALTQTLPWVPSTEAWRRAAQACVALEQKDIGIIPVWQLPLALVQAAPVAPALFVRGNQSLLAAPAVGVVGARAASPGPRAWAFELAYRAAQAGWVVVSGGARGIDAAAHEGALAASKPTVAYLGVAADKFYPNGHRRLFERILLAGGALVSEHPPGSATPSYCHAQRNRFIAAQAHILAVAEAQVASGSLGTAAFAKRLGRRIVVPGSEVGGERGGLDALLVQGDATVAREPRELAFARALLGVV